MRFHEKVHFRIVAQWFKMSDADDWLRNGFLVDHASFRKFHDHTEPFLNQALQHGKLYLSHNTHLDFLVFFVPQKMKLGVFLLKLFQSRK